MNIILRAVFPAASLLAGCVQTVDVDKGEGLVLDATKRVVLVKSNPDGVRMARLAAPDASNGATPPVGLSSAQTVRVIAERGPQDEEVGSHARRLICAEPSPDALSALAASGALSVGIDGQGGSFGGGVSEAAALAGRTGAMQILRDLGYRACEGAMNGVIGAGGYNRIMAGTASTVLGLVAVEGLTGTALADSTLISPPPPAATSNVSPSVIDNAAEAADEIAGEGEPNTLSARAERPGTADARPGSPGFTTGATVGDRTTAQGPGGGTPAPNAAAVTDHAADAVVKVVCLATAGTSRDRATRQKLIELCLGRRLPAEEIDVVRNDPGAGAGRQHVERASLEHARR